MQFSIHTDWRHAREAERALSCRPPSHGTTDEMREMQWVRPELVAQIRFVEWTAPLARRYDQWHS